MVAPLTDAMLTELDRNQGGPVQVEDPRTHARYVLISHESYRLVRPLLGLHPTTDAPVEWSDAKNSRRLALIKQEIAGTLSGDGMEQLERLQDEFYRYREQVAPLPSAMLTLIEEALERRVAEQPSAAGS